jgi:hypothetical protein
MERSNTNCSESLDSICSSSNTVVVAAAAVAPAGSGSRKGKKCRQNEVCNFIVSLIGIGDPNEMVARGSERDGGQWQFVGQEDGPAVDN